MKKCVLQIFSLCLAIFIAYIGGGLNIYHYCCDACEVLNQCTMHNAQYTMDTQTACAHDCCTEQHSAEEVDEYSHIMVVSDLNKCGVTRIDGLDFIHFNTTKISFIAPLIATLISAYNSQVIIRDYKYTHFNKNGIPIAHDLSGRAIVVRKSAYLI